MVFSVGQTVRLKSGGPLMTIIEVRTAMNTKQPTWADCQWFDDKNQLKEGQFLLAALEADGGSITF